MIFDEYINASCIYAEDQYKCSVKRLDHELIGCLEFFKLRERESRLICNNLKIDWVTFIIRREFLRIKNEF